MGENQRTYTDHDRRGIRGVFGRPGTGSKGLGGSYKNGGEKG